MACSNKYGPVNKISALIASVSSQGSGKSMLMCRLARAFTAFVNDFFFISQPKHMLWVLKRTVSMFKLMDEKIIATLPLKFYLTSPMYKYQNLECKPIYFCVIFVRSTV